MATLAAALLALWPGERADPPQLSAGAEESLASAGSGGGGGESHRRRQRQNAGGHLAGGTAPAARYPRWRRFPRLWRESGELSVTAQQ